MHSPAPTAPHTNTIIRAQLENAVDRLIAILDRLDGDPDAEDGGDAEPSLAAPEGHASQIGWCRGGDADLERDEPPRLVGDAIMAVLELLADPDRWTRGAAARDAAGRPCSPTSSTAVAWSLDGAIERVIGDWEAPDIGEAEADRRQALELAVFDALGVDPAAFNDAARDVTIVTDLLRGAAARAGG